MVNTSAYRFMMNTGITGITTLLNLVMGFIILSVAKTMLGDVGLGVWALALGLAGMAALVDFGFGPALGMLIAKHANQADTVKMNQHINAFVVTAFPLAFLILLVGVVISPLLAAAFVEDMTWQNEAGALFALMFVVIALRLIGSMLGGVLIGHQMMGSYRAWLGLWSLIRGSGIVWLLYEGIALGWIGSWIVLTTVAGHLTVTLLWYKSISLRYTFAKPSSESIKELWNTAVPLQVSRMSAAILNQADKFILAWMIGAAYAGWYELAAKMAGVVLFFPGFMLAALAPLISAMQGDGEGERIKKLLQLTTRYLNIVVLPMAGFLFLYADSILHGWLGSVDAEVVMAMRVMLLVYLVLAMQQPYVSTLLGMGDRRVVMRFSLVILCVNVPLSLMLVERYGFAGSYWATLFVVLIASIYFFTYAFLKFKLSLRAWLKQWLAPFVATLLSTLCMYNLSFSPDSFLLAMESVCIWAGIYVLFLWLIGGVGSSDIKLFHQAWKNR